MLCLAFGAAAQMGEIKGKVLDEPEMLPMPGVHVYVEIGSEKLGDVTNTKGNFTIKPLSAGVYNVYATFTGFKTALIKQVVVKPDKITFTKDIVLKEGVQLGDIDIISYVEPLINIEEPSKMTMLSGQLEKMPGGKDMTMALRNSSTDIKVSDDGQSVYFRGARANTSAYYIDGVKRTDLTSQLPSMAVGSVTIYSGGVPAKYGDATGGVVVIESKSYFDYLNEWKAKQSRK